MTIEKTYKYCSYFQRVDDLILEAAEDIKKGYHVIQIEKKDINLSSAYLIAPNVVITLRKEC